MTSVAAINNLGGYAHNPRGNIWFNDESTYGHKLLMKMGWNKGKGLGKNEDGIKENLKVKYRSTNSGLGFKDDAHANIMKTEYESILKNLSAVYSSSGATNQNKNDDNSEEQSCQKTRIVKSKLRYPKLFFGKDVTKYSEKDFKSIFICSTPLKSLEEKSENLVNLEKKDPENESSQTLQTYSSSLSISDYFAKKMKEKKSNIANKQFCVKTMYDPTSLESKNAEPPALTVNENISEEKYNTQDQLKIKPSGIEKPNEVITETKYSNLENLISSQKNSLRKKKKKCKTNIEMKLNEIDPCVSNGTKEKIVENSLNRNIYNNHLCDVEKFSKPNKKRKLSEAFKNDPVESSEITYPCETKSLSSPKKKKKKKKDKKYSTTVQLSCENSNMPIEMNEDTNNPPLPITDGSLKKEKKKKLKENLKSCLKRKCGSYSFRNISFNENVAYRVIDSDIESVDPLALSENLDENTLSCKLTGIDKNNSDENLYSKDETSCDQNSSSDICDQDKVSEELDERYTLSDLPSPKSCHYNPWIESQRQALRMELYQKMLQSIKTHKIFKTTNLLSIKGYGNWGFK